MARHPDQHRPNPAPVEGVAGPVQDGQPPVRAAQPQREVQPLAQAARVGGRARNPACGSACRRAPVRFNDDGAPVPMEE
ncbi:unnamed protein product [Bursaphelenchus xylophilus]|uniref:(pine wood nematode) hypothetical protein n=1 Tax=Bursaphelenchus xylophilus TaxID=6326 RepID=A0A1I7S6K6_BURXY|nr:unnamed protein product [Bursaphelenchus xylophilus]CAG9120520.1 unnamed protein product [Bursaphelenchus xylophilus]